MNRTHVKPAVKLAGVALLAPLMAACAQQDNRLLGPPVPSPLSVRQAARLVQGEVGGGAQLSHIDCLSDGQLFGVDARGNNNGPPIESRLLFVHNNGTIVEWPGR